MGLVRLDMEQCGYDDQRQIFVFNCLGVCPRIETVAKRSHFESIFLVIRSE